MNSNRPYADLGDRISRQLREIGMTRSELGKRVGYTNNSAISHITTGARNIPEKRVPDFARALEMDERELRLLNNNYDDKLLITADELQRIAKVAEALGQGLSLQTIEHLVRDQRRL